MSAVLLTVLLPLSGEGLHGETGVRRSSRNKHAPLEYWRNERKVYNREFRSECPRHHLHLTLMLQRRCMLCAWHRVVRMTGHTLRVRKMQTMNNTVYDSHPASGLHSMHKCQYWSNNAATARGVWQNNCSTAACSVSMSWSTHLRRDFLPVKLAAAAAAADMPMGTWLVTDE